MAGRPVPPFLGTGNENLFSEVRTFFWFLNIVFQMIGVHRDSKCCFADGRATRRVDEDGDASRDEFLHVGSLFKQAK